MQKRWILLIMIVIVAAVAGFVLTRETNKVNFYGQVLPVAQNQTGQKQAVPDQTAQSGLEQKEIWVGGNKLTVEIADTIESRAKGLGERDSMDEEQGMLFLFDQSDYYAFWMKDMKIPLDFIWITGDKIVDITPDVPAPKNLSDALPTYQPKEKADKVLEVNAGWAARHQVKIGNPVKL